MLATAWAAQSALWQLEWLPDDDKRKILLPRLAESMARRVVQQEDARGPSSAEIRLLCLRTLEVQSKWEDMLQLLEDIPNTDPEQLKDGSSSIVSSEFGVPLTQHQIQVEKANILRKLHRSENARLIYETLLNDSPDDWSCWKGHLESAIFEDKIDLTRDLVTTVLKEREGSRIQLRGPHLMSVEIATENARRKTSKDALREVGSTIQKYAEIFAYCAACTFSDLEHYVNMLLRTDEEAAREVIVSLLEFADALRQKNKSSPTTEGGSADGLRNKERQSKLRAYIFAVKLTHKLVSSRKELADRFLPDWTELVAEWRSTLSLSSSNEGEEVNF
jgi:tetratricopeptide (TPR) repeat protein